MKKEIEEILINVSRPSRYIGNELNSYQPDMSSNTSIVLCFPDIYEIAASNLGIEILYHLINEKKLARCERCFAPDLDMEAILREKNIDLFSLESGSSLKSFDIVGFSVQCEMSATNIINMLDLSKIAPFSKDRAESDPLIIAGGPSLANPEPFCDFFDLFVLGDGEETIEEIIDICRQYKKLLNKRELLIKLSQIEGVYVPSLYNVEYNSDNTVKAVYPNCKEVKPIINKKTSDLSQTYFPNKKIIPFVETVHNRLNIEVARGCPGACRFCQASKYYYPWRQRSLKSLLSFIKDGLNSSGYEEISFSSLSSSDYKELDKLINETDNISGHSLNISLPSLRCNERSLQIIKYINKGKRPSLTFAPEAGNDRLRNVIGKYLSEDTIIRTLLTANQMGWDTVKLYFMIGLPTETQDDIEAISNLIKSIKSQSKNFNFNITVSPFVPKAQTAFQWQPMLESDVIKERIDYLVKKTPATVKPHNSIVSVFEALIAKGDRKVSSLIYKAWQKGAKFDQWADRFNSAIWHEALKESGIDLNFYVYRKRDEKEIFAWDHIHFGIDKNKLFESFIQGINEKSLNTSKTAHTQTTNTLMSDNYAENKKEPLPPVMRVRLRLSKKGIVRFISHLEQIEVFRRAIRRSKLPIAFTGGFSPNIKASYGLPLSVGQESLSEYIDLYLIEKVSLEEIKDNISKVLPSGFNLLDVKRVPLYFPSIDSLINAAEFKVYNARISQGKIISFLDRDKIIVTKEKKKIIKEINIRPLIKSIFIDGNDIDLILSFNREQFIKPEIVLKELYGDKIEAQNFLIERSALYIETSDGAIHMP
jgi:radical SAM family uncharacterized protein/radical SAM-linked protein